MTSAITEVARPSANGPVKKWLLTIYHPATADRKWKKERLTFDTKSAAEGKQAAVKDQYAQGGASWGALTDFEKADAAVCIMEARQMGTTLRGVMEFYKGNSGSVKNRTMTLREMVNLTIQTKTASRRSSRYLGQLRYHLERFAKGRESLLLTKVTPEMVNEFLANQKGKGGGGAAGSTIQSTITRLKTMFSIACKNNKYLESGANPMDHVELPYIDIGPPVIFTPQDAEKQLWVCRVTDRPFLAYLVLGLFGGIRPEELEKLRWRDIHLDEGEIVIEEGVSKTRSRRCFEIEPVLMEWLKKECYAEVKAPADGKIHYVPPDGDYIFECEVKGERLGRSDATEKVLRNVRQCIQRHRERLCKRSGVKWHQDILRKTCASVLMCAYENETKVAAMLGNSPKILHRYYRGLLRRKDLQHFQSLTPTNVRNDPILLPVGGSGKKSGVLI